MTPPGVIVMHKATFVTRKPCAWRSYVQTVSPCTQCLVCTVWSLLYALFVTYKPHCQCERCLVCIKWIIQVCINMKVVETRWLTNEWVLRGGADKSLARTTFRCRRTEWIVSLERGVCSCAELQVFSCYRGWKEACQATRAISTTWRHELSSFFFSCKARRRRKFTPFWHKH